MRAHVFQGDDYYPRSGIDDCQESFDDIKDAEEYVDKTKSKFDWSVIAIDDGDGLVEYLYVRGNQD